MHGGHQRPMPIPRLNPLTIAATLAITGPAWLALAQSAPSNLSRLSEQHTFSENDRSAIQAFVDRELAKINSDDPSQRTQGRQKLIADLQGLGASRVTPAFRITYSEVLIPELKDVLSGDDTSQAIVAEQVASRLGTDTAVTLLDAHVDARDEERPAVRLWAAGGIGQMIDSPSVDAVRMTRTLRRLADAAKNETSWAVLNQQMRTLHLAVSSDRPDSAEREEIRTAGRALQAEVLADAIARMGSGQIELVLAIEPATRRLRDQFLAPDLFDSQRDLIVKTAPALSGLYGASLDAWEPLKADDRMGRITGRALNTGEVMIVLMDNAITGNNTQAHPDYEDVFKNDFRAQVEAGHTAWNDLPTRPAYRR